MSTSTVDAASTRVGRSRAGTSRASRTREAAAPVAAQTALVLSVIGTLSLLALWAVAYPILVGGLQEHASQAAGFDRFRSELSQATAPTGPTAYDKPVALLDSNAIDLHGAVVVEGTAAQDLQKGPGHRRDSVLPGQTGTSVLLGKSVTFGGPFKHLTDLKVGQGLLVTTGQGAFHYRVERLRRPGDPLPPPLASGGSRLVLETTEGVGWRGALAPTSVVYVDALLVGNSVAAPGGRPTALPAAEQSMGRTSTPLLVLVFWLQGVLVAVVGAVWLRRRWGRWQSWSVAVPVLVALGVGASGTAAQLLPNLL